jgi:hypothetical protein
MRLHEGLSWIIPLALFPQIAQSKPLLSSGPQLNREGFAHCLGESGPEFDLSEISRSHQLSDQDLLILHLAVYPGVRWPGVSQWLQDPARKRWTQRFEAQEEELAQQLLCHALIAAPQEPLTPSSVFARGLAICGPSDVFCAALISHNVLRTLGRHEEAVFRNPRSGNVVDYNPRWFKRAREFWIQQAPQIQGSLISLRKDGGGDRWGEWYHSFGVLTYAVHEMALHRNLSTVALMVRLSALLNPVLVGGPEDPEKAQIDRDMVRVAWLYLSRAELMPPVSCQERGSYVLLP